MKASYKSSAERLVHFFRQSRENWKQRAAEKQRRLRAQAIRIRDLEHSRALWKQRAQAAEHQLREGQPRVSVSDLSLPESLDAVPEPIPPRLVTSPPSPSRSHRFR